MTTSSAPLTGDVLYEQWPTLSAAERVQVFQDLSRSEADAFFLDLNAYDQAQLVRALPAGERRLWLRLLAPDDAADLLQNVPDEQGENFREEFLGQLDETTRSEVRALLAYREDEAGGRMSPRFARLRPEMTVDEALAYLRRQTQQVETIYYAYALDADQHLRGVVSLRDLFRSDRTTKVSDVMRSQFVCAQDGMDQEALAKLFSQYHLLAIPVVDPEHRMKGIVTIDDIVQVVQEEASEDIQKIGGMEALDEPYLQIGLLRMVKKRAGWLAILFVGEMLTATAMGYFEDEIAKAVVLALFLPLIISSGGNSGSQATTLVIRAMALGEVRLRDWYRVVRREILTGLALGLILAFIGLTRILVWQAISHTYGVHYSLIAITIAASLVGVVLFGSVAGSMLPFLLRRCGLDPASASAPFVATLVDVTGLVIYFNVASLILRGTLL